ncbi:MAG: hypothetical protein ABSG30_08880 [Steroidobacteraceae bacterium]|jgi:hypothetical protein
MRLAFVSVMLLLSGALARGAELYYLDRDAFNNEYVGPVGPLVLSGEIAPGDYDRLLAKIAEDDKRFLSHNKLVLASSQGNAAEAMKIAQLVKALYTQVVVGPLTGRCAGACFLIYVAAVERGTDGENLLGMSRPGLAESEWVGRPTTEAALFEDGMQGSVRDFLVANDVPSDLLEQIFQRPSTDVYWLSDSEETALGAKSPAFGKFLAKNCKWTEGFEKAVYRGERPFEDLKAFADCRARTTLPEARKALTLALKEAAPAAPGTAGASETFAAPGTKPSAKRVKPTRKRPAESKTTPSS